MWIFSEGTWGSWVGGETDLDEFEVCDALEACVEEGDLLYYEAVTTVWTVDVYSVADVVGVLDEEEDAGAEEFLGCDREDKGEGQESCGCGGEDGVEASVEEAN